MPFGPVEEQAVKAALRTLTGHATGNTALVETTIPALWHQLANPTPELIHECRYATTRQFLDETRLLRDALGPARRRRPGRPVRRPHHHRHRLGRPHPVAVPVPADAAG